MDNAKQQKTNTIGTKRVVSYFWHMTMTRKWPFIIAVLGMIIASLTSLYLPIYYTKIIDIVQIGDASRLTVMPQLM